MIGAFVLAFAGALLFASVPRYPTAIVSLFLIGAGMAALQVAINPLLRVAGGEEHYAFNSVLAQLIFGGASFLSPFIYTYFVRNIGRPGGETKPLVGLMSKLVPPSLPWVSVYWVFAVLVVVMIVVLAVVRFPIVVRKEEERAGAWETHKDALQEQDGRPLLPRHLRLRRDRAGRRQLDLPVPLDLPRLRSRRRSARPRSPSSGA